MSSFLREILCPPQDWIRQVGVFRWHEEHIEGGHFASVEQPDRLVGDLRE